MNHLKVLIIEDNLMNLELVEDLLLDEGLSVLTAEEAITGIETTRSEGPDLILMDLQLPGIDGLQATRMLKEDDSTSNIPVIALTAHAMSHHGAQAKAAGCQGFISKPIDADTFVSEILAIYEEATGLAIEHNHLVAV